MVGIKKSRGLVVSSDGPDVLDAYNLWRSTQTDGVSIDDSNAVGHQVDSPNMTPVRMAQNVVEKLFGFYDSEPTCDTRFHFQLSDPVHDLAARIVQGALVSGVERGTFRALDPAQTLLARADGAFIEVQPHIYKLPDVVDQHVRKEIEPFLGTITSVSYNVIGPA